MGDQIKAGEPIGDSLPQPSPALNAEPIIRDNRLDRLGVYAGAVVVTVSIAVTSWFFGNLHARLDKAEERIYKLREGNVKKRHQIQRLEEVARKQWELISENGKKAASQAATLQGLLSHKH